MRGQAQSAGKDALRVVERGFDHVFGAKANPWHHLGALGFYLFWIVVATGIYLYAFFDTSVEGAHRSVERMTIDQWYAGGVIRSLHRYAADAFVVVVALHLVKELVAGRFSGFRWFSWVTGVPLLWLMFASGMVGYWLAWDQLAQFVAIATNEWLDWLPDFSEPLARNFVTPSAVNDRLFTLLMFLHLGIALRHGADGVLIAACREGECAFRLGERWLLERLAGVRAPHLRASVPRERARLVHAGAGDEAALQSALDEFEVQLERLPSNPARDASRYRRGAPAAGTGATT